MKNKSFSKKGVLKNAFSKKDGRAVGVLNGVSGAGSVISAHNVCHSVCLAVVAFLSFFGIIVSSDILMWLQDYNILFWSMGMAFLFAGFLLMVRYPNCMPRKMIIFNSGLLIAGFPFVKSTLLLIAGAIVSASAVGMYLSGKFMFKGVNA